jgi:hypothetical protein
MVISLVRDTPLSLPSTRELTYLDFSLVTRFLIRTRRKGRRRRCQAS